MSRHALSCMEHLDGRVGDAGLDHLADQPRRYRIEMPLRFDVVIGRDPAASPFGIGVWLYRQWQQRGPVERLEELPPACPELAHQA